MAKVIILVPARYESTRFPGKPLIKLLGKPMIIWVAELANQVLERKDIFIATDNQSTSPALKSGMFSENT